MLEQPVAEGLQPVESARIGGSSWKTVSRGRDPTLEQGKSVRSPPLEEERVAETNCDKLTTTPIPCPTALLVRRR